MKDESVAALLESGEIQMTEDVIFMVEKIIELFERAAETGRDQFISHGLSLLELWRESLETNSGQLGEADSVIDFVMGKS